MRLLLKMKIYTILGAKEIGVTNSHGRVVDVVDFEEVIGDDEIAVAGDGLFWIGFHDFADLLKTSCLMRNGTYEHLHLTPLLVTTTRHPNLPRTSKACQTIQYYHQKNYSLLLLHPY